MTFRSSAIRLAVCTALMFAFHLSAKAADPAAPAGSQVQTLVFLRHAEKPANDLGQLTGQGFKRALALPNVLLSKFGKPDHIFAPSPDEKVHKMGLSKYYYYVRPCATIEPTAVCCQLPINLSIGFTHVDTLQQALADKKFWNSTVFIVWEHWEIHDVAANILKIFGADPAQVPLWQEPDYDSLYVITISRTNGAVTSVRFVHDHEGLDNIKSSQINLKYLDQAK